MPRHAFPKRIEADPAEQLAFNGTDEPCGCAVCDQQKTFSIPRSLIDEFATGDVVIFAGAGVSTEGRNVLSWTLYSDIRTTTDSAQGTPFADVMTKYCERPNGRLALTRLIRERIDHIESFPALRSEAVRFHRELGTLPFIDTIITTNWDTFFERECHATPFVFPEDLAYWHAADRRVLKIHGTIENLGSMIVTRADYERSLGELQSGQIGAFLKTICTNKTLVFVGYSIRDEDFLHILTTLSATMGDYRKQFYAVTLDETDAARARFRDLRITPIFTDATFFISQVKAHLVATTCTMGDHIFDACATLLDRVRATHSKLYDQWTIQKHPHVIFAASYQDGMIHGLERALNMRGSGEYSDRHRLLAKVGGYEKWIAEKKKGGIYEDVAYIEGYMNAIMYLIIDEPEASPPLWYMVGAPDIHTEAAFRKAMTSFNHKRATKRAKKMVGGFRAGMVFEHRCQI